MVRLPKYAQRIGRNRYGLVEAELTLITRRVARARSGKARGDRERYERGGINIKTLLKYLHVTRIWIDFCLAHGVFHLRWKHAALTPGLWAKVAVHMHNYSNKPTGLSDGSLEGYMRMLSHVLIYMAAPAWLGGRLHGLQRDVIQRVVDLHCLQYPKSRTVRNTKSAWSDLLVDAALQLLLQWQQQGNRFLGYTAWPAFARMNISMLNYLGWRPFSMTRDRADKKDRRWCSNPILSFGMCRLSWDAGVPMFIPMFIDSAGHLAPGFGQRLAL